MTASNHFLAGALIGATIGHPVLAGVLAIGSHFVLDALPHYGYEGKNENKRLKKKFFRYVIELDALVLVLLITATSLWLDRPGLVVFGLLSVSPDLMWVYQFMFVDKFKSLRSIHTSRLLKFHAGIQKLESPYGIFIEIPLLLAMAMLLAVIN